MWNNLKNKNKQKKGLIFIKKEEENPQKNQMTLLIKYLRAAYAAIELFKI